MWIHHKFILGPYFFKEVAISGFVIIPNTSGGSSHPGIKTKQLFSHHGIHARWSDCAYGKIRKECDSSEFSQWTCHLVCFPHYLASKITKSELFWLLTMGFFWFFKYMFYVHMQLMKQTLKLASCTITTSFLLMCCLQALIKCWFAFSILLMEKACT